MKSLYQKKAKNRKGNSAYLPDNEVCLKNKITGFIRECGGKVLAVGLKYAAF